MRLPFLNTGMTFEILHKLGNLPLIKERLIKKDKGFERISELNFNICKGILFGPADLPFLKVFMILETSFSFVRKK